MNMLGAFPKATGQWSNISLEVVTAIIEREVQKFVWKNMLTRLKIPRTMVSDNGHQFDTNKV